MTVGVAAIARSGGAIVAVADRLLTYGGYGGEMTGESATSKLLSMAGGWYVLYAGRPTLAEAIVGGVKAPSGPDSEPPVSQMRSWYDAIRESVLADAVLKPRLLTKETYLERPLNLQPLDPIFRAEIDTEIRNFSFDCQLLACGFDPEGHGTLFVMDDGGFEHAKQGFACVGSGGRIA